MSSSTDEHAMRNTSVGDPDAAEHGTGASDTGASDTGAGEQVIGAGEQITGADSVAAQQALLALFIDDPSVEGWVRRHPRQAAERYAVSVSFAQWLAQLPAARVRLFRRSRIHKQRLRDGAAPTLLDE